jgi:DNA/RNA endonuclease G (NUC1)
LKGGYNYKERWKYFSNRLSSNTKKLIDGLKFVYGKYETYQVQINKIDSFTGLDFGNLNKFDPMTSIKASSIIIGKASDIIYNYASKVKIS